MNIFSETVERFWFTVGYTNVSGWGDRMKYQQWWRDIAAQYPNCSLTVWEPYGNGRRRVYRVAYAQAFRKQFYSNVCRSTSRPRASRRANNGAHVDVHGDCLLDFYTKYWHRNCCIGEYAIDLHW